MTDIGWDHEYDVVVIGAGASGMSAAITAATGGLSVIVLEKTNRVGGSTAISGGAVWAPLTAQSKRDGPPDTLEKVITYMRETVGSAAESGMQQAFLQAAPVAIDWLEAHSEVKLAVRTYSPDYHPDRQGAALGGRTLDPLAFDGRRLGTHFRTLRDPLPEFMVLGGMMITMTDARHLLAATKSFTSFREGLKLVLRYCADRLRGYHRGTRLVLGNALAGRLFRTLLDLNVPLWLEAPVRRLHRLDGRVLGVTVEHHGKPLTVRARCGVVVATGGFPWDTALRNELFPHPTGPWSMAPESNTGEGIGLARAVGATFGTGHSHPAFWAPVSILRRRDGSDLRYPHLVWDRAKPGLMAVDGRGRRFVNEATSYHDFVGAMYRSHAAGAAIPSFLICDTDFIKRWGMGLALPGGRPRGHLERAGYLYKAASIAALAQLLGLEPAALQESVERFNAGAAAGEDKEFGKGSTAYNRYLGDPAHTPNPCLGPLQTPPFYAIKVFPGDIGTAVGLRCNQHAQALDASGQIIAGLYAVGNDMQSVMGGQYPAAGITLGPALTFGWIAGRHLVEAGAQERA
ncbi:MAG: FAD-dependent oxidoreductase [Burkholderiaceae bacterium]